MIIKRKYFSDASKEEKEEGKGKKTIKVGVSAGLGAGSSALLANKLSKDKVLDQIAEKIEWKQIGKQGKDIIEEHRGEKFQKIADQFRDGGKVKKFLKSKKGKTAIIGTAAIGFGLAAHKSSKKKDKKEKED